MGGSHDIPVQSTWNKIQSQFSYNVLFPSTLWYFPLNYLKIINKLSKSKREFSFMCGGGWRRNRMEDSTLKWNSSERRIHSLLLLNIHFILRIVVDIIKLEKKYKAVFNFWLFIILPILPGRLLDIIISTCFIGFLIIPSD